MNLRQKNFPNIYRYCFWYLRVTQKELQLSFFFSSFFFLIPSSVFGRTGKSFLNKFRQLFLQTCLTKIRSPS